MQNFSCLFLFLTLAVSAPAMAAQDAAMNKRLDTVIDGGR